MNKLKLSVFGLLVSGVVAFSAIAGVSLAKTAYAADGATTTAKFVMKDGGSVRVAKDETDKTGIRWTAIINEEYYNSLNVREQTVEFGAVVTPARNLSAGEDFKADSKQAITVACSATEPTFNGDGEFIFNASIVYDDLAEEQKQAAYALELVARAYVKVGAEYHYVDTYSTTRSMRAIALAAVQSGAYAEETLNGYYGKKTVNEATENTGYYGNVDESSVLENKHNISGDIQAYIGAKPVSATITGEGIVVTNAGELEEEKSYTLNVFGADGNVYSQPFVAATKVIRTAADLAYFELKDITKVQDKSIKSTTIFDGYYVVAKDIDATGYEHQAVKNADYNAILNSRLDSEGNIVLDDKKRAVTDTAYYSKGEVREISDMAIYGGLVGTFDGAGHTISNLTVIDQGIFGLMANGTVKNVAFTGVTLKGSAYKKNICLIAQNVVNGTFENVYVKANPLYGGEESKEQGSDARGNRSLIATQVGGYYNFIGAKQGWATTNFINCVFDYEIKNTKIQYCYSYGLYAQEAAYYSGADAPISTNFNNVYLISNATISVMNNSLVAKKTNTHVIMAENDVAENQTVVDAALSLMDGCFFNGTGSSENTLDETFVKVAGRLKADETGVLRYATAEDMNAAGNDYTSFSSAYWSISEDGVLSWKA